MANGIPYEVSFATGNSGAGAGAASLQPFTHIGGFGRWREGINPMRSIGDDLSWAVRRHAFKMGFEWRRQESNGFNDPNYDPVATIQSTSVPGNNPINGLDGIAFTGLTGNAANTAKNLLSDLTGSIARFNQAFGVVSAQQTALVGTPAIRNNRHWNYQSEMSVYFKDDWKFRPDLTLNLGVHWEYYGQPYEHYGLAARVIGDQNTFLNVNCTSSPGTPGFTSTCSNLAQVQFVGKNSTHPDIGSNLHGDVYNSFAPSVGFAWDVPWFGGKGKTVVRSGYGISYEGALRNFITVDGVIGTVPGINLVSGGSGLDYIPTAYTSLANATLPIPFPAGTPTSAPFTVPTTDRSLTITTYNRRANPYTQNWNFEIQRQVANNTTVEVRYIGTKGSKIWGTEPLNAINALTRNRALFDAFNTVRIGGESPLLDQMLMGINFGAPAGSPNSGVVNGTTWTGAMAVRANTTLRTQLANGSVGAFANTLNTVTTGTGSSVNGAVLRRAGFPENYIVPNPQYNGISMLDNLGNSTYHSLQLQFTRRLTKGFTNTTTWTWSKSLGDSDTDTGAVYRDPTRRSIEKSLLGFDRAHQITSNGTYELPFGTGHFLLGNAPGWVQQVVNKWQLGGIMNFNTGAPLSLTTAAATNATASAVGSTTSGIQTISNVQAQPNVVAALPKDMGRLTKVPSGVMYFDGFTQIADPGIANVTTLNGLNTAYSNKAIVAPNGQVVLVNPQPGEVGTLGLATIKGPRSLGLDMNLIKRFRLHENKEFEFRIDAVNVLNHPNFGLPNTNINAANTFGRITTSMGSRRFIINSRINF